MNHTEISVCGIVGSLREGSYNRLLMESAARLAPEHITITISEQIGQVPLFNEDLIGQEPAAVQTLRDEVARADALMVATPEYNFGIPGVLKNALDWLSLPHGGSALHEKPVVLIGTSPGRLGTARSQLALRNVFIFTQSPVLPGPELLMPFAHQCFDDEGHLTDAMAKERLEGLFAKLPRYVALNRTEGDAS